MKYQQTLNIFRFKPLDLMDLSLADKLMGLFVVGYAMLYILIPSLGYQSILPDSAQNLSWGHSWSWSYNRHPPLGTWLISVISLLGVSNEVATFSASVFCLATSLWFIYLLSKRYLSAQNALVSCILTTLSLYYFTNFVLQYNQNSIMLPFWVMICYFLDKCLQSNRLQDWFFLALVTTGAMLAKYESLLIIFIALVYLLWHFEYKFIAKFLFALVVSFILLIPHMSAVAQHGFLTIEFIHGKAQEGQQHSALYTHLYYPFKAFIEQIGHLIPALILLTLSIKNKGIFRVGGGLHFNTSRLVGEQMVLGRTTPFNYLIYLGFSPFILVILLSFMFGLKIQPEWGFPLFSFTMPAIMVCFQFKSRAFFLKPLFYIALFIHALSLVVYMSVNYFSPKFTRTNNPGYALAKDARAYWHQLTNEPLKYVAGDENFDYYLAAYLPEKPLLLEAYSLKSSPWVDEDQLKKSGLLLVIEGCDNNRNLHLKAQFSAQAYQCVKMPLSNKYRPQFKNITFMIVLPKQSLTNI